MSGSDIARELREIKEKLGRTEREKTDRDIWLVLWGAAVALLVQVVYDEAGQYPVVPARMWVGIIIAIAFWIGLWAWAKKLGNGKTQNKISHFRLAILGKEIISLEIDDSK
jgi:uncharacterized membrane protein